MEFSSEFLDLAKDHQPSEAEKFSILQTFFLGEGYSLYHPRSSDRYGRQSEKGQKMHSLHSRIACNMASVLSNSNGKFSSDHDQALRYVQVFLEGSRDFHPSSALKLELLPSLLEIGKKDSVPMARRINALSQALSPQGCYISENERESVDYDCYSRLSNEASEVLMSLVKSKPEKVGVKDRLEALKNLFAYSPVSFGLKLEAFNIFGELYRIPSVFLDSPEYLSDIASYGEKKTASHEEKETATKLLTFVFTHEEFSLRRLLAFMRTECKWGYYGQDRLLSGRASLSRAFTAALERKGPSEYVAFQPEDADREAYYLKQQFEDTLEILSGYVVSLQGSDQAVNQFLNVLEADGIKVETRVKLLDKFLYEERGKSDQKNRAAKSLLKLTDHIEPSADNQGDVYGHMLHLSRVLEHSSEGNTLQVVFSKLQEIALNTELARETRQRSAELIIGGPDEFDRDNSIAVLEEFARQDILGEGDRNLVTLGCTSYSKGFDLLLQIAGEPRIPSHRKRLNILRSIMEAGPTRGASEEQLDRARGSINKILFELSSSPAFSDIPLTQYPEMMELFLNDAYWGSQSPFLSARNKEVGKVSMKRYYDERLAQGEKTNVHLQERIAIADEILQGPAWALGTLSPEQRVRAEELKKLRPTQKGSQPGN